MEFLLKTLQIPQEVHLQWGIIIILWMIIIGTYLYLILYFIIDNIRDRKKEDKFYEDLVKQWNLRH